MAKKIVTNLRIDAEEWAQIRAQAAELNMSANEYLIYLIRNFSVRRELGQENLLGKEAPVWNLGTLANKQRENLKLSDEDELIYD